MTHNDKIKEVTPLAIEIYEKTGIDVWVGVYSCMHSLSRSSLGVASSLMLFKHALIGRNGTKKKPFKFKDIARRVIL